MPQLRPSTAKKANKSKRKKKNELQIYATTWMTLKGIVLSKNKVHPKRLKAKGEGGSRG